jgi:hypothetical protein
VFEKLNAGGQHGNGVGVILPGKLCPGIPSARFKKGIPGAIVGPSCKAWTSNEAANEVAHNCSVQVRQDHDIELPRIRHQLHATKSGYSHTYLC